MTIEPGGLQKSAPVTSALCPAWCARVSWVLESWTLGTPAACSGLLPAPCGGAGRDIGEQCASHIGSSVGDSFCTESPC